MTAPARPLPALFWNERDCTEPPFPWNDPPPITNSPPSPPAATVRIFPPCKLTVPALIRIAPPVSPSGLTVLMTPPLDRLSVAASIRTSPPLPVMAAPPLRKLTSPPMIDKPSPALAELAWPRVAPMICTSPRVSAVNPTGLFSESASAAVSKSILAPPSNSTALPANNVNLPTWLNCALGPTTNPLGFIKIKSAGFTPRSIVPSSTDDSPPVTRANTRSCVLPRFENASCWPLNSESEARLKNRFSPLAKPSAPSSATAPPTLADAPHESSVATFISLA